MERAFYTSAPPPDGTAAGFVGRTLTPAELVAVHKLLHADPSARYVDTALTAPTSNVFYSLDAAYDTAGTLLRSALVLHDSSGQILASEIDGAEAFDCDGCGEPTLDEGIRRLYDVRNLFVVPGFTYPILLLDASTVEGRGLSLETFLAARTEPATYGIYEYVVNCILSGFEG